jgi:tRNA-specific 2-thiouridylase
MIKKIAIGLFSGGLDSWLSALLIQKQGFEVYLIHFVSPYFGYSEEKIKKIELLVKERGMNLVVHKFGQDYIDNVIKAPKHGTGSAINACVDCHRYMLQIAKKKMEELKAEFVFSGEVLGQRPMSQRKEALNIVEKESGLRGYLVRPLSAKLLKPTIPEKDGVLKRNLLMDIFGRGRKRQVELAAELNLKNYPQPAGGCKFTDINLIKRFSALTGINKDITWDELELIKFGRHFNLGDGFFLSTARDEGEVKKIYDYSGLGIIIEPKESPGSTGLLLNYSGKELEVYEQKLSLAGQIIARYSKDFQTKKDRVDIIYIKAGQTIKELALSPLSETELKGYKL